MFKVLYVTGSKGETVSAGDCCDLSVKIAQWSADFLSVSPYFAIDPGSGFIKIQYPGCKCFYYELFESIFEQSAPFTFRHCL